MPKSKKSGAEALKNCEFCSSIVRLIEHPIPQGLLAFISLADASKPLV